MMDVRQVGELELITSGDLLSYVPICNREGGYIKEESGGKLNLREFDFSVAKFTSETLTIPPYFINKKFCVVYGACLSQIVIDSYGGEATELGYIKFTGESLDNLTGLLQQVKKDLFIESKKSKQPLEDLMNQFFAQNILRVTFEAKYNRRDDKYYAALFETVPTEYPEFSSKLRTVNFVTPTNITRVRSSSEPELSASPSASASTSYRDDSGRNRSLPSTIEGEDYGF